MCQLAARVLRETKGDAAKAAEAVCFRAVATDSKDNISCMIVLLGNPLGAPPSHQVDSNPNPNPNSNPNPTVGRPPLPPVGLTPPLT